MLWRVSGQAVAQLPNRTLRAASRSMCGDGKWHRAVVTMENVRLQGDIDPGIGSALLADTPATTFHRLVPGPK